MKRIILLSLIFCVSTSVYSQQSDNYLTQSELEVATIAVNTKLDGLLARYEFPKTHIKSLEVTIGKYEYDKALVIHQFQDQSAIKQRKLDSLTSVYKNWEEDQIARYKNALKLWEKVIDKYGLSEDVYKTKYLNYHFYIGFTNASPFDILKRQELVESDTLKKLTRVIARKEAERIIAKCSSLKELDTTAIKYGSKQLYEHLKSITAETLTSFSAIKFIRDSDRYCSFATDAGIEKQEELSASKLENRNTKFVNKAIEEGVSEDIANTILGLIEKRKNALEALKQHSNNGDNMSDLFENTDPKTKSEIKKEFASNLANLISKSQFAKLFGNEFLKNVNKSSEEKLASITNLEELSDEQKNNLNKMLKLFYYNEQVTSAYYSFDKKVKKQKLSALRYRFKIDYEALMGSFGKEVKPSKKVDQRSYKWD